MSFHRSSSSYELIGPVLCADCRNIQGKNCPSTFDLDQYLGNRNGFFEWGGKNFSKTAKDVHFVNDGLSFTLHASLRNRGGSYREATVDLSRSLANHNGKLVYVGSTPANSRPKDEIEEDPLAAAFSDVKDFAQDLTQSLFGFVSPAPSRTTSYTRPRNQESQMTQSQPDHSINLDNDEEDLLGHAPEDGLEATGELSREEPVKYEEPKTPVPERSQEEDINKTAASSQVATSSLNELSASEQEEFQYELIMRTIKQFLLQGPGASVTSNINQDGQRELVFSRGEEKFTLLASKISPEILFDQDEHIRTWSVDSSAAPRCLTPETVEGEDDDTVLI